MAALTTKLNIKNGSTVQTVTSYSTQDEGTVQTAFSGTTNLGTYWKITNNGVDAYIGLWPTSVTSGGNPNHSALQVIKGGTTYYVETIVKNTFTLTLAATTNQTITLKYTEPGASQVTKTSTSSAQNFTVKVGTTWTATIAGSTYYTAGTLSASSGTVRADTTVSATAATHITYTITLTQKANETVTIHYQNHNGSSVETTWHTTTDSITLGKGSKYYSTIALSGSYTSYYTVGTITSPGTSGSPNTLNAAVTISFTAATHITYTITLTQKSNETVTIHYKNHSGTTLASSWSAKTESVTLGKGSQYYSTIALSGSYTSYYSVGTITSPGTSGSPNTLNGNVTISFTAATHITYTITLTQKSNETVNLYIKKHSGTSLASSYSGPYTSTQSSIGKDSKYYSTISASTGYTAGTITSPGTSGSPNTLNGNVTISFTAATIKKYTVYAKTSGLKIGGTARSSGWSASYNYNSSISVANNTSWDFPSYSFKVYKGTSSSGTLWLTKTTSSFSYNVPTSNTAIYNLSDCNCDCNDCCVAEGTLVTCWDNGKYTYKKIEDIQSGDTVVGANGQLNEVYARTDTILGKERTMFTFIDNSLYFTGEHSMWVRYKDEEYFGIHDISGYYREKTATVNGQSILEWEQEKTYRENGVVGKPISKGLSRDPIFVLFDADYGTDKGWKHNQAIIAKDKVYENDTPIHTLIVGGNHTFFANGYLVSGFATDIDYDYKNVKIEDLKLFEEKYYEKKNV